MKYKVNGQWKELSTLVIADEAEAYEAGKKAEYDAFWDEYQLKGKLKSHRGLFGSGFNAKTFKPKYPIKPLRAFDYDNPQENMFYYTNRDSSVRLDLTNYPVDLSHLGDTFKGGCSNVFVNANVDNVFVDLKGVTSVSQLFTYANSNLKPKNITLRITESLTSITNMFHYLGDRAANELNISFTEDSVLVASLALSQTTCITKAGIENIFAILSNDTTDKTLTLKSDAVIRIYGSVDNAEWQALVASKPNWTIALS